MSHEASLGKNKFGRRRNPALCGACLFCKRNVAGSHRAGLGWPRLLHERCLDLCWHLGQGGALGKAIQTKDATSYGWAVLVLCGGGAHVPVSPGPPLVSARAGARTVKESIRASVRVLSGVSSLSLHVLGPIVVSARVLSGVGCPS